MSNNLRYLITVGAIAVAFGSSAGMEPAQAAETLTALPVPFEIQVPEGNTPFLKGNAVGTQNYLCMLSTTGPTAGQYIWRFLGPQATLFTNLRWMNSDIPQQIVTHFLSVNPREDTARPTWQSSLDTSAVWGQQIASSTDPNFVSPRAIPWLLLEVVGTRRAPAGGQMLTPATFIQRVNTSGGTPPSLACSETENNGTTMFVPYKADYVFYRATPK
jgi:hypothetical protein